MNQTAPRPDRIAAELAADLDAGFADLFEAHQHVLFSTALRICGGWADAEDLTATAFLRAFRALSGYDRERIAAFGIAAPITRRLPAWAAPFGGVLGSLILAAAFATVSVAPAPGPFLVVALGAGGFGLGMAYSSLLGDRKSVV